VCRTVDVGCQVASDLTDVVSDLARDEVKAVHDAAVVALVFPTELLNQGDDWASDDGDEDGYPPRFHGSISVVVFASGHCATGGEAGQGATNGEHERLEDAEESGVVR
jgi:hypothetical protein